jgi:nitroreductase
VLTRKAFIISSGGVVLGGAAAGRAWQTGLIGAGDEARALWRDWRALPPPMSLVAAGVLAASPHNSQPWLFHVRGETIDLTLDERRTLGPVDPFARQMWLGAGCAVENMVAAGAGIGRVVEVAGGENATRLTLGGSTAARPELLEHISRRHTNRALYHRDRPLDAALKGELTALASDAARLDLFDRQDARGRDFEAHTVEATRALITDGDFMRASDSWFRATVREEKQHRDGPSLRCSGLPRWKWVASGLAPRLGDAAQHKGWLQLTAEIHCASAPTFGAISVRAATDHKQLLEAGRLWQRLQLAATARGLGFQPLDQLLELADRDRQLHREGTSEHRLATLTEAGWHPVLTFRIGWPRAPAPASARRPLPSFLLV